MKKVFVFLILLSLVGMVKATGPVAGDSIFLFNNSVTNQGLWTLGLNNQTAGAYLPQSAVSGGYDFFVDAGLSPYPNNTLVGDIDGDGVSDAVIVGDNGAGANIFLARKTEVTGNVGDLLVPSTNQGWPNGVAADGTATDFFLADVDGDGIDDAITRKHAGDGTPEHPWDGMSFWEAYHSDSAGMQPVAPASYVAGIGTYANTALMGDFNGDGAVDVAEEDGTGFVLGMTSILGTGLSYNPGGAFWGSAGTTTNHVATLVGDINGDGKDDIVQVDDRNGNGSWGWVAYLTGSDATPAGIGIGTGGVSWAFPFSLDTNSTKAVPLLADLDNDGKDDLVLYEEYTDAGSGNTWSRILAAYTVGGDLFSSVFNEGTWYDWVGAYGAAYSNLDPMVGNVHIPEPITIALLGLGGLLLRRKKGC